MLPRLPSKVVFGVLLSSEGAFSKKRKVNVYITNENRDQELKYQHVTSRHGCHVTRMFKNSQKIKQNFL